MKNKNSLNNFRIGINRLQVFLCTLLACGMMSMNANAQLYTRTTFNTAYVPISVGTGATVSTATGNDVNQTAIPLGFTFNYAGVNYTTVGLNTNGLLFFDAVAPIAAEGAAFNNMFVSGGGGTDKSISAWWADMIDDASSDILYQTQGTAGSQTFTVQYTNYPHWRSTGGTNVRLNTQVIFYEGTNVIEFNYGTRAVTGPPTVSSGACIGIEYGTGGAGNFIDLVTGSGQTSHGMLSPLVAWPAYSYRLTPGAPAPVAAGTYNVGIGQTYPSLTLATSDLNHRGISGPVTLNLTDANYDTTATNGSHIFPVFVGPFTGSNSVNTVTISKTGAPATFSYRGSPVVQGGFGCGSTGGLGSISDSQEPIMGVSAKYTTISNINLVSLGTTANDVEIGLMVFESFGGDSGAQHNVFDRISVNMDRTNANTIAIHSNNMSNPGGIQGSNSFNTYRDITIRDSYAGIYLQGAGGVYEPDAGNQIISSSCTVFNSIGDPSVPNDIGGGSATYGIWLGAQNTFIVRNTIIRNITTTSSASTIDGILVSSAKGVCEISNNIIRTIKRNNTGAGGSYILTGMRLSHSNSINEFRIFNNSISELLTNYTGVATASRAVRGIYFDDTGAGTNTFNIWNNSISIDGSTFPNASNTCIQFSDGGAFTVNMKNNVLANFTSAQTGVARHYCIVSSHVDRYGLISSLSDYNDLYIANDQGTSGHVGLGASTNYSTLAAWQAGMSFNSGTDANSVSANPNFVNNATDLHATSLSTALDETGTTTPAYITTDIDCQARVGPHDMGSDDFTSGCAAPPVPTGNAIQNFCSGSNPIVADLTATGAAIQWYAISSGGSALATSIPLVNGTHYFATQTVGSCESTARLDVTALVSTVLPANSVSSVGGTAGACDGEVVLMTSSTVTGQNIRYSWNTGSNSSVVLFSNNIGGPFTSGPFESATSSVYAQFGALSQGSSGYNICVQGVNGCGTTNNKCTWVRGVVSPPASITGSAIQCDNATAQLYSAASVPGATVYTWSFPGATITTQGNQSVNIDFPAFTSGQLCVTAALACGGSSTSAPKCMTISNTTINPGAMSGPAKICPGQTGTVYSIPAIAGAAAYNWTVPAGASITAGAGTNSITVSWPNPYTLNNNVCVTTTSACGDLSEARCKSVISSIPEQPGNISGQANGVCGQTIVYTVASVPQATSYTWAVPAGGTINSGQGTNAISVTWGIILTGQVSVTANSACGSSSTRTLNIAGAPGTPGTITSAASVCNGQAVNFSITTVPFATSYVWTLPNNGTVFDTPSGQGTISINVIWGTGAGTVTVKASNACGLSSNRNLSVAAPGCRLASLSSTGSEQTARDDNFTVYPNPAHEMATISFKTTAGNCEITIMDLSGRIISATNVSAKEGMNNIEVDLSRIAKGVYIVELNTATSIEKSKLIIE